MEEKDCYSEKNVDYIIVNNKEKQEEIIYLLFQDLGFLEKDTKAPFRMLREFQFADGVNICGTELMGCSLSGYLLPNEYGYFGENNVSILDDATNKGFIMSEKDFYPYIEKYSGIYMKNNLDKKAEVLSCLKNIKKRFKIE